MDAVIRVMEHVLGVTSEKRAIGMMEQMLVWVLPLLASCEEEWYA